MRLEHSNLTVTVARSLIELTIPVCQDQSAAETYSILSGSLRTIDREGLIRRSAVSFWLEIWIGDLILSAKC